MFVPTLDIFRGSLETGAIWTESAEDLASAIELMRACAKLRPGSYFVFDCHGNRVVATVHTSVKPKSKAAKHH
jgi:hypothetical protein